MYLCYTPNLQYSSSMTFLTFLLDTIHRLIHTVTYEQTQPLQTETKSRPAYGVEGGTPEAQVRRTEGAPSQRASPSQQGPFGVVCCRCPVLGCRHGAPAGAANSRSMEWHRWIWRSIRSVRVI